MSKIEVNEIDKTTGSTLTLGGSGTAVTLGTGATQSGFGRTGTVDWQTGSIKTATFTAANGEGYFANTAGGAFTMNLPAGSAGAIVSVQDYNNTFDSNALTVDANGSEKINGGAAGEPVTLNTEGRGVTFVYIDATVGWRSVQDNDFTKKGLTPAFVAGAVSGSGNTLATVCTNFKLATFTGPGTFTVSCAGNAAGSNTVEYLVVAGGGGGGSHIGGGGGGGGNRYVFPAPVTGGLAVPAQAYPITIGGGGAGATDNAGSGGACGVNSTFSTITSTGGGRGGSAGAAAPTNPVPAGGGYAGGSGGGGGHGGCNPGPLGPKTSFGGSGNTPSVSPPQGKDGGKGFGINTHAGGGGGGGGSAGVQGSDAIATPPTAGQGGPGGNGSQVNIDGNNYYWSGGGGGTAGVGGPGTGGNGGLGGGGGASVQSPAGAGTGGGSAIASGGNGGSCTTSGAGGANSGGGGGGGAHNNGDGGAGGSGIVIIRYRFQ